MAGALAALIAIQAMREYEPLATLDRIVDGARGIIPAGIVIAAIGAAMLIAAGIHGMVFDATRAEPGEIEGGGAGPSPAGGWRARYFKGNLLWGASFEEESGISELKRSWLSGEWLDNRRYFRATLVVIGLPLLAIGMFGTMAVATEVTAVRLMLILVVAFAVGRFGYVLARS